MGNIKEKKMGEKEAISKVAKIQQSFQPDSFVQSISLSFSLSKTLPPSEIPHLAQKIKVKLQRLSFKYRYQ